MILKREEGNPKRKLRKRRAKRQAVSQLMETIAPPAEVSTVPSEESSESYAVSSRGRVRKVKKMINYDGLDFEKLAIQASEEAEQERVRKRRKREEEEREREEQETEENVNCSQPSAVRRYLLSHTGHVMGYIDNDGQVHSGSTIKDSQAEKGKVDISNVRNLASQLVANVKKESSQTPLRTGVMFPRKTFQNTNLKPGVPTVVVAAINSQGSPVYVRVVGEQALQLVKYMKPSVKGPVSQIKLQHHGQTYTVNTNAHMITHNIPGLPDGEAKEKPSSVSQSTMTPAIPTSSLVTTKPSTRLEGLATSNSPSVPRVAPITSVVSSVSSQPNTLALAYRGMTRPTRPMTVNAPVRTQGSLVPGTIMYQDPNRLSSVAPTRLVTASPSVVSSVMSPTIKAPANAGSSHVTHNLINVNQQANRQLSPSIIASSRPQVTPLVRTAVSSGVTPTNAMPHQQGSSIMQQHTNSQQQIIAVQAPTAVAATPNQPLGQTVTATTIAVPGPGGQPQVQLKLESESLAQLMQRTGSKIVALPNGRGGYTLSLTPGAVQPGQAGQKNQTHLSANAAAKVQVVSCSTTPLLQDTPPPQTVQQPPVIQQQSHVISQGVAQAATVVQQASSQQLGIRQMIPVSQSHAPGTIIKDTNAGTQVVVSGQQAVYSRVGTQQRVYNNLVSSSQGTRCVPVSTTTVMSPQQSVNNVSTSQSSCVLQKVNTTPSQSPSYQTNHSQQQYVVQQRVVTAGTQTTVSPQSTQTVAQQSTTAYKPVIVNQPVQQGTQQVVRVAQAPVLQQQQIVRLQAVSGSPATTQKLVQIVQPGGGRQVVQMVQQVVASQGQPNTGHQGLIYVQGSGQVLQQHQKNNLGTVHHTLQGATA
ncbi:hypothetical protein OTU49_000145, partial [Cherax quadricarinatus]